MSKSKSVEERVKELKNEHRRNQRYKLLLDKRNEILKKTFIRMKDGLDKIEKVIKRTYLDTQFYQRGLVIHNGLLFAELILLIIASFVLKSGHIITGGLIIWVIQFFYSSILWGIIDKQKKCINGFVAKEEGYLATKAAMEEAVKNDRK